MKRSYLAGLFVLSVLSLVGSAHSQTGGGTLDHDLTGGAEIIFRRPEDPKTEATGGRIAGTRTDRPSNTATTSDTVKDAHVHDQTIAKGNAARSASTPRYSEAELNYRLAAQQDPDDPRPHAGLGNVYLDQGRFKDAVDAYRQAIKLNPDYQAAYMPLGFSLIRLNKNAEAIDIYNQLLKMTPDDPEVYNNLGYAYNHSDRFEESVLACQKAISLLGVTGQAYKQGLQNREEVLSQAYKNLGYAFNGLKRYNEAAEALKQSTAIEPKSASAHFNLGLALYNGGRYGEAIESYKEVLRLKPGLAQAHYNLGLAYVAINNKALAMEEYNTLKGINKNLAEQLRAAIP